MSDHNIPRSGCWKIVVFFFEVPDDCDIFIVFDESPHASAFEVGNTFVI